MFKDLLYPKRAFLCAANNMGALAAMQTEV